MASKPFTLVWKGLLTLGLVVSVASATALLVMRTVGVAAPTEASEIFPDVGQFRAKAALEYISKQQAGGSIDVKSADRQARRALAADPYNADALLVMGIARAAETRSPKDAQPFLEAGWRRTKRHTVMTVGLLAVSLESGKPQMSAEAFSVLMQRRPQLVDQIAPSLFPQMLAQPVLVELLAKELSNRPSWGGAFLQTLGSQAPPELVTRFQAETQNPTYRRVLAEGLATRNLQEGQLEQAAAALRADNAWWQGGAVEIAESENANSMNWLPSGTAGTNVMFGSSQKKPSKATYISVVGTGVTTQALARWFLLRPGGYSFTYKMETINQGRFALRIGCGPEVELSRVPAGNASSDGFARVNFTVPAEGCAIVQIAVVALASDQTDVADLIFEASELQPIAVRERSPQ